MADPAYRAVGVRATGSSVTTISVAPPAGHQAGDLLVILAQSYANPATTIATPSGWTALAGDSGGWGLSSRFKTYVFWKLAASSSEPNVSIVQAATGFPEASMFAFQNVHASTPIDVTGGWGTPAGSSTLTPVPAMTTATDRALAVYLYSASSAATTTSAPNSSTQHYDSAPVFNTVFKEADVTKTPAGSLPATNWITNVTSSASVGFAFAVRPGAAAPVTPVADFTGTPTSGTEPLAVTFTDTSTNTPTSWAWTFGDGGTSTSQNPSHTYTVAGTYTVTLQATNTAGSNTKTRTGYVVVSDQPRPIRINTSQGWMDIADATSLVSGTGPPTVAVGATGGIYLDTASGKVYGPKAGGAWPSTAIGKLLLPGNTYADVLAHYTNYAGLLAG